ncbi:MAG: hypothetical protein HY286_01510 [Planctomycetes bacterium]|nr:hypothetical protein [Planctomycetota bacterium]
MNNDDNLKADQDPLLPASDSHANDASSASAPDNNDSVAAVLDLRESAPAGTAMDPITGDAIVTAVEPEKPASKPRPARNGKGAGTSMRPKKLRNLNYEEAFELLLQARSADQVHLYLRDGRMIEGAILFNDIKGTGRIINVIREISVDFKTLDVRDIRF